MTMVRAQQGMGLHKVWGACGKITCEGQQHGRSRAAAWEVEEVLMRHVKSAPMCTEWVPVDCACMCIYVACNMPISGSAGRWVCARVGMWVACGYAHMHYAHIGMPGPDWLVIQRSTQLGGRC